MVALAAIRARVVNCGLLDLGAAAQLDPGVGVLLVSEAEADVLEAGGETDTAFDRGTGIGYWVLGFASCALLPTIQFLTPVS